MIKRCTKLIASIDLNKLPKHKVQFCTNASLIKDKWDLIAAVCLERKPIVTPALNEIENKYKDLMTSIEFERSLKSDHELRHETEQEQLEKLKKGGEIEVHFKQTAQDLVDVATDELNKFKFGPRVTDADKKNDVKSLNRKLDKHLVLVVGQKIGEEKLYLLPQRPWQVGETLRQTAERVLKETCTDEIKASIYGNAPSSFYKYRYPKSVKSESGSVGAKMFIYFARYVNGQLPVQGVDYKWLDRQELFETLPAGYQNSISDMLIDE